MKNIIRIFILLLLAAGKMAAQCDILIDSCAIGTVEFCDLTINDSNLWNETYWWDSIVSQHDMADAPLELSVTATDNCPGATMDIRYVLYLNLDGVGSWETAVRSWDLPSAGTVDFGNFDGTNFIAGESRNFDKRPIASNEKYRFAIEETANGWTKTARVRWNTDATPGTFVNPELPYGTHKIKWLFSDNLGNADSCEYLLEVKDCKQPTVVCYSNLSLNIQLPGTVPLWASDMLQYADDNNTPAGQLQFAIRKVGDGTGFPVDSSGSPITLIIFNCDELGSQAVEVWGKDKFGNADFCVQIVEIEDNGNFCNIDPDDLVSCASSWCGAVAVSDVTFTLTVDTGGLSPLMLVDSIPDANGCAVFPNWSIPLFSDYYVTPSKDGDDLNGVDVLDLILMAKHILGLQPLSLCAMIAADVNKSNSISTFDIVESRKLIQGIYTDFPDNTSWRFLPADFTFLNPANPFLTAIPDSISAIWPLSQSGHDFIAIKVGDVNCSAYPGFQNSEADIRAAATLTLPDAVLLPGETLELPLRVAELSEWLGFQFGLRFDPNLIEIESIAPGDLPGMDESAFARPQPGALNTVWFNGTAQEVLPEKNLLTLKVKALVPIRLSEAIFLAENQIYAQAYTSNESPLELKLEFTERSTVVAETAIFQPQPNPTASGAKLPVQLAQSETVTLELFAFSGKRLWFNQITLSEGSHLLDIPAAALPQTGVYVWRMRAGAATGSGRLVKM